MKVPIILCRVKLRQIKHFTLHPFESGTARTAARLSAATAFTRTETSMTDRKGLGMIGYLLGGLTAAVMLVGGFVVNLSLADDIRADEPETYQVR